MINDNKLYTNTPTDIEKETGRKFIDIIKELTNEGLSPTEITHKLKLKSNKYVSSWLNEEKHRIERESIDKDSYILKDIRGRNRTTIEGIFKYELNIAYKDWLYQKYIVEGLSVFEITKIIDLGERSIYDALKYYGIHKDRSQMRKDAIKKGLIDYNKITSKSRRTMRKSISKSNSQDMFRELIRHHLEINLFQLENYDNIEIVIGSNEWGILHNKEVDIPVIVIIDNNHYKYSIEYNNELWHDYRYKDDKSKKNELINKGWKHFIYYEPNNKTGHTERMEKRAQEIATEIIESIKTN